MRKERITQGRSAKAAKTGMERRKDGKTQRRKNKNNHDPVSTSVMFGNSLEIPLVYLISPANLANDATFPFVVMTVLSTTLLAPELRHTCLLGIIIYCAEAAQVHHNDLRPSNFERIVHLLACLPLFHPSHQRPSSSFLSAIVFSAITPKKPSFSTTFIPIVSVFASCAAAS